MGGDVRLSDVAGPAMGDGVSPDRDRIDVPRGVSPEAVADVAAGIVAEFGAALLSEWGATADDVECALIRVDRERLLPEFSD